MTDTKWDAAVTVERIWRAVAREAYADVRAAFRAYMAAPVDVTGEARLAVVRDARRGLANAQETLRAALACGGHPVAGLDGGAAEGWYELNLATVEEIV